MRDAAIAMRILGIIQFAVSLRSEQSELAIGGGLRWDV